MVVGKSPDPGVAASLARHAAEAGKPAVLALPEAEPMETPPGVETADTLEAAAIRAAELVGASVQVGGASPAPMGRSGAIRGLFCGGTLRDEALSVFARALPDDRRPLALDHVDGDLDDRDALIDFGSESLVRGRPHPMIDPQLRDDELVRHAVDPRVGVILADVVLGRCAHPDPAASLSAGIEAAIRERGPEAPAIVVSLCGAERDPQGLKRQAERLLAAGAHVARSNAEAARIALRAAGIGRHEHSATGGR